MLRARGHRGRIGFVAGGTRSRPNAILAIFSKINVKIRFKSIFRQLSQILTTLNAIRRLIFVLLLLK
jgi:hypothetical protein